MTFILTLGLVAVTVLGSTAIWVLFQLVLDLNDEVENLQEIVFELFERHG